MEVLKKEINVSSQELINLSVFEIDNHYYARTQMDQERIKYFKLLIKKNEKLSPIKVCFYNNTWICLDGHMTLQAYKDSNVLYIECEIIKDIQPDYFILYSAKFNLFSSKPLSQEELTKVIYEARFVNKIPVNEICSLLGFGSSFVYNILKPYTKKYIQDTINRAIELHINEGLHIDDIAKILGYNARTVYRWINNYENPLSEDKKLFESLKTNSSSIFIDKELNTFLCMQLIKKNMEIKDVCNSLNMHSRDVFIIGYLILYCYQNPECSIDDIVQYFRCKNIEQLKMIHFMRVYFLNLLVDRKLLFDWLETHCDLHDEIYRKIVHNEMLHNITIENESDINNQMKDIDGKKVKNKANKNKDNLLNEQIDQIDVLNPKQLALVVDNFKKIEDEFVVNKKEIDSEKAKKILEQMNRLMTMMNSIMPLLVKSINFK